MTDGGLTRRSALGAAGVVAVGVAAGYAGGRNTDAAKAQPPAGGDGYGGYGGDTAGKPLAKVAEIPDGGGVIHSGVVITRSGNNVHAFSAVCTHQGCTVNKVSDGKIDCPCHSSVFDATSGAVLAGPAPAPLPKIAVTVRNGEVYGS